MEALYSKLYDKYTKLKTRKDNAMEELNRDQEMKFMKYMSAADDLIEHLRSEKDTLRAEVSELRSEVASIRYAKDEQYIEYQKRLLEENQKYIELSEEIERLRSKEFHSSSRDDRSDNGQLNMSGASPIALDETNRSTTRKRSRDFRHDNEVLVTPCASDLHEHAPVGESVINLSKQPISNCEGVTDSPSCIFQELAECLVDLKFSIASQTDEIFISAVHESSGYSFSLRWMNNSDAEVLYRASSLGTFERVAPEWMRQVLLFSKRMCPIFFKRVSYAVKLHN